MAEESFANKIIDVEELVDAVIAVVPFDRSHKGSLSIEGRLVTKARLFKYILEGEDKKHTLSKLQSKIKSGSVILSVNQLDDDIMSTYKREFNDLLFKKVRDEDLRARVQIGSGDIDMSSLIPCIDLVNGSQFLQDPVTLHPSGIHFSAYEKLVSKDIRSNTPHKGVVAKYDPYDLRPEKEERVPDIGLVPRVNTYRPPAWRLIPIAEEEAEDLECPELVDRLLTHLFPKPDARRFVVSWMRWALVYRAETYLVLNGAKGIGKGVFSGVLKCLVGSEHYGEANRGMMESQFNSVLTDKRLIVFDEISMNNDDKLNLLKSYANEYQNIERKHESAEKLVRLYVSCVITNNSASDMIIRRDDRRFSVMDMTDDRLEESMTRDEIAMLKMLCDDEDTDKGEDDHKLVTAEERLEFHKQLGNWVLHHGEHEDYDAFSVWKGENFERLVSLSLPEWQRFIVELMADNPKQSYDYKSLAKLYAREMSHTKTVFPRRKKIKDFVLNYRDEQGDRVGSVEGEGRAWKLVSLYEELIEDEEEEEIVDALLDDDNDELEGL